MFEYKGANCNSIEARLLKKSFFIHSMELYNIPIPPKLRLDKLLLNRSLQLETVRPRNKYLESINLWSQIAHFVNNNTSSNNSP